MISLSFFVGKLIEDDLALALCLDHVERFERLKLMGNRRLIQHENARKIRHAHGADGERGEDFQPGDVCKEAEELGKILERLALG